jgi:hypothetical protein
MRQFDVCRLKRPPDQLVIVIQHDVADELDTRVVAPLSDRPFRELVSRLRIPVQVDDRQFVIQLDRLSAVPRSEIGRVVSNLGAQEYRLKTGLDLLFFGI